MWPFRKPSVRKELDLRLRLYVDRELPRLLGVAPSAVAGAAICRFAKGAVSHLRYVEVEGYGRVVLRVLYRKKHLRWLAGYPHLAQLLASNGIEVPRIILVDDAVATRRAYGFAALVEEFVEGAPLGTVPEEARAHDLRALADVLARLHAIRSPVAGKPWQRERWEPERRTRRARERHIGALRDLGIDIGCRPRDLAARLVAQLSALGRTEFPLVHGDPNPHNFVATPRGRLCVLDLNSAAHWFPQVDLLVAELTFGGGGAAATGLLDAYFQAAGGSPALSREGYDASRPLFAALYCFEKAGTRARGALRLSAEGNPDSQALDAEARQYWARGQELLAALGGP